MPARPNILLLFTDQQRGDALGAAGNPDILTPNLDRLAATGTHFTACHVQNPVCMPSRASLLSGRYPSALGITAMGVPFPENEPVISHYFAQAGYHTANLGKLHFLPHANRDHTRLHPPYGFHHLEISDEPGVYEDSYRAWVRSFAPDQLEHLSTGLPPARRVWLDTMGWPDTVRHPPASAGAEVAGARVDFDGPVPFPGRDDCTYSAWVANRTIEYLRARRDQREPFACIASFYSPHAPWIVPQRFLDLYRPETFRLPSRPASHTPASPALPFSEAHLRRARHGYYAMVTEVDHYVGCILASLADNGLEENTIVAFISDHGEWLGEHRMFGKGYPAHDAVSHVPFILKAPGAVPRRVEGLVEGVDLLPSLLELAGLPLSSQLQGTSLAGACRGEAFTGKSSTLTEHTGWCSLRTARHRYVVHDSGEEFLYDLGVPAGSYSDLAVDLSQAACLAEHRQELLQRLLSIRQPHRPVWPY